MEMLNPQDVNINLIWKPFEKEVLRDTPIGALCQVKSLSPENKEGKYIVLDGPDVVIIIPELEDCFLMVEQWRHGSSEICKEFPGGVIDKGETPEQGALRELLEETGLIADRVENLSPRDNTTVNENNGYAINEAEDNQTLSYSDDDLPF